MNRPELDCVLWRQEWVHVWVCDEWATPVGEPATWLTVLAGLAFLFLLRRWRS